MRKFLTLVLLVLASCGMGKKGDKISHRPQEPENRSYILTEWYKISKIGHIPAVRMLEHTKEGRVKSFVINGILVDPRTPFSFNATWRGPGALIGGALSNYNPNHALSLKFVIDEPVIGIISYSLVLERFGDELVGLETIRSGSNTDSIMHLTFERHD